MKIIVALVVIVAAIAVLIGLRAIFSNSGSEDGKVRVAEPIQIPGAVSRQEAVYYDATADGQGRIHVAWRTGNGETWYTHSTTNINEWLEPVELGGKGRPRLVVVGNRIRILVLGEGVLVHASNDGGDTWEPPSQHFPGLFVIRGDALLVDSLIVLSVMAVQQTPRLLMPRDTEHIGYGWAPPDPSRAVRNLQKRIYVIRSETWGESWDSPIVVADAEGSPYTNGTLTLTSMPSDSLLESTDVKVLHVSWVEMGRGASQMGSAHSNDNGFMWSKPTYHFVEGEPGFDRVGEQGAMVNGLFGVPKVLQVGPSLLLSYASESGGVCVAREIDAEQGLWRRTERFPSEWTRYVDMLPVEGSLLVAWVDPRRARRGWWAGTFLESFMDGDGRWPTNDLFVASVSSGGMRTTTPRPITPMHSYVRTRPLFIHTEDQTVVLWWGHLDISNELEGSRYRFETNDFHLFASMVHPF